MMARKNIEKYISRLTNRKNFIRLFGAAAGSLIGFFILMAAIQLFADVKWFMANDEDDLFGPGMLVINKRVNIINTAGLRSSGFSEKEITRLREKSFIKRVEPFVPCRYKVSVRISMAGYDIPDFLSEFFFEAIPDDLVEMDKRVWHWDENSKEVPVVLPADFLRFYNFGFAPGQNLPPLSEKTLQLARLHIVIQGNNQQWQVPGRIAGLSERVNTILVPQSFMDYSNKRFGDKASINPSRLVVVSYMAADPELTSFIRNSRYETSRSELRSGKLNQLLQMSVVVTGVIGLIIIALAFYIFVLSFSLFIVRSNYEFRTLIQIGLAPVRIEKYLIRSLLIISLAILILDIFFITVFHKIAGAILIERGINLMPHLHYTTVVFAALVMVVMVLLNTLNIKRNIKRLI